MAIAQPAFVSFELAQAGSWTVTLSPAESVVGWEVTCTVRAYNGGPVLITKSNSSSSEIAVTDSANGVFVVYFSTTDLALLYGCGAYVIQLHRVNVLTPYPITDRAPLLINAGDGSDYPTLTNLGEYLAAQQGSLTIGDAAAQQVLQQLFVAEDLLMSLCQRRFTYSTALTEYYDGTGTPDLLLRRFPVASITSLYLDLAGRAGQGTDPFPATSLQTSGDDYYLVMDDQFGNGVGASGIVRRIAGNWPMQGYRRGGNGGGWGWGGGWGGGAVAPSLTSTERPYPGCIKITYVAGYRLIPHRIKQAVWTLTTQLGRMAIDGRYVTSESGEGESVSYDGDVMHEAMRIGSVAQIVNGLRPGSSFIG